MTAYINAMGRYFDFSGRSTRAQFWYYHLALLGLAAVGIIIDAAINGGQPLVSALIIIAHYVPSLAITVRRLHDADMSGWLVLLCLVPGIGIIAFIAYGCIASTAGSNRFGPADRSAPLSTVAAPTAASGPTAAANIERIEKLASLRAAGTISDDEFQQMKSEVLAGGTR
ncbi:DUF805 domain-containing protein [Sinorhizobium mexicanum]|uniref:DUF805 domain-containing protein n=1 Tax=Sinorhizobium mexicanum TaxID=375549 RepID=A0A859QVA7_9HYPH|nr:DUF805 domain-containing protein [Sinorhizobium mexicanum]MBP1885728.1 uncharacterized membrane protein YhaH (DUF805 family) [Sinorhizobium mexicanum]QLL63469.1 DUF805 domain-containing protein [Sinorhizobium mexicanum]